MDWLQKSRPSRVPNFERGGCGQDGVACRSTWRNHSTSRFLRYPKGRWDTNDRFGIVAVNFTSANRLHRADHTFAKRYVLCKVRRRIEMMGQIVVDHGRDNFERKRVSQPLSPVPSHLN